MLRRFTYALLGLLRDCASKISMTKPISVVGFLEMLLAMISAWVNAAMPIEELATEYVATLSGEGAIYGR